MEDDRHMLPRVHASNSLLCVMGTIKIAKEIVNMQPAIHCACTCNITVYKMYGYCMLVYSSIDYVDQFITQCHNYHGYLY